MIDYEYPEHFDIKYKIVEIDEQNQLMVVRYWTDWLTEEELAIDSNRKPDGTIVRCKTDYTINIWDHMKTQEDIENVILNTIPVDWFKLQYAVKTPEIDHTVNGRLSHLKNLVNKTFVKNIKIKNDSVINKEQGSDSVINKEQVSGLETLTNFYEKLITAPNLDENEIDNLLKKFVKYNVFLQ